MGKNASGMYVIDEDYNIVNYNHEAKMMYPQLIKQEKCYKCLMDREIPCDDCPIARGIEEPKNYLDPLSRVLRSVDAVGVELESGKVGYALFFSAAEATEEIYRELTGNGENTLLLGVVDALGKDYSNIYSVDRETHKVRVCRFHDQMINSVEESLIRENLYEQIMDIYIENNVAAEDKIRMQRVMDFQNVCERLTRNPQFIIHYKVRRGGMIHYYYVKCARIGEADNFTDMVFAFANEDMDVQHSEMKAILEPGGTASRRKLLIIEDNELNRRDFAFKEESFPFYLQVTRKNRKDPYGIKSYSFFYV